jgi:ferritin-like metal-binding protein YciE
MKTLENLFLDELRDVYDAEHRIIKALPKMRKAATCPHLQATFDRHLTETNGQINQLNIIFASIKEKPKRKKCDAIVGLLEEGDEMAAEYKNSPSINAALIAAAQKVEHYEMATYGCLREWAARLGNEKAAKILNGIFDQEQNADEVLTTLARMKNNHEACQCKEPRRNNLSVYFDNSHENARKNCASYLFALPEVA